MNGEYGVLLWVCVENRLTVILDAVRILSPACAVYHKHICNACVSYRLDSSLVAVSPCTSVPCAAPLVCDVYDNIFLSTAENALHFLPVVNALVKIISAVAACCVMYLENAYQLVWLAPAYDVLYFLCACFCVLWAVCKYDSYGICAVVCSALDRSFSLLCVPCMSNVHATHNELVSASVIDTSTAYIKSWCRLCGRCCHKTEAGYYGKHYSNKSL